jgi:hypothetical protein
MSLQLRRSAFTARSVTLGTFFNIIFGTLWVGNGLHAFQTMQPLFLFVALAVVSTTLLVADLHLFRSVRHFSLPMLTDEFQRKNRTINHATIIELAGSIVLSIILVFVGRNDLVLPLIVLSVGLYLLVLAPILGLVQYYVVGVMLCTLPIGTVLLATPGKNWLILIGLLGGSIQFVLASINLWLVVFLQHEMRMEKDPGHDGTGIGVQSRSIPPHITLDGQRF